MGNIKKGILLLRNRLFFEGCDTCYNTNTRNYRPGLMCFCKLHSKITWEKDQWRYMFRGNYICRDYKNRTFQGIKRWITGKNKIKSRWIDIEKEKASWRK